MLEVLSSALSSRTEPVDLHTNIGTAKAPGGRSSGQLGAEQPGNTIEARRLGQDDWGG